MADLLPPSPSAVVYNPRYFTSVPSQLGAVAANPTDQGKPDLLFTNPRPVSPPRTEPRRPSENSSSSYAFHSSSSLGFAAPLSNPTVGPLDYSALVTNGTTYSELTKTINDLATWLSVVETGLNGVLEGDFDTIKEEQEIASESDHPVREPWRGETPHEN